MCWATQILDAYPDSIPSRGIFVLKTISVMGVVAASADFQQFWVNHLKGVHKGFGKYDLKATFQAVDLMPLFSAQVKNSTHLLWTWHRNQDHYDEVVGDQIYIVRQPQVCANQNSKNMPKRTPYYSGGNDPRRL